MANKKTRNSHQYSITTASDRIICKETAIQLSDEKLKSTLLSVYEISRADADKFKLYKQYGVFLSMGVTLLISLLTADFKSFSSFSSKEVHDFAFLLCVICFLIGFALLCWNSSARHNNKNHERDKAIEETMRSIMEQRHNKGSTEE